MLEGGGNTDVLTSMHRTISVQTRRQHSHHCIGGTCPDSCHGEEHTNTYISNQWMKASRSDFLLVLETCIDTNELTHCCGHKLPCHYKDNQKYNLCHGDKARRHRLKINAGTPSRNRSQTRCSGDTAVFQVFEIEAIHFLKCLKVMSMENNPRSFTSAVRTLRGAPRPTCDSVRVNTSAPAPRRCWCNPDPWIRHMASVAHTYLLIGFIQQSLLGFFGVSVAPNVSIKAFLAASAQGRKLPAVCLYLLGFHKCWVKSSGKRGQGALLLTARIPYPLFFHSWPPRPTSDPNLWLLCLSVCVFGGVCPCFC